jgi:hypothetical protein
MKREYTLSVTAIVSTEPSSGFVRSLQDLYTQRPRVAVRLVDGTVHSGALTSAKDFFAPQALVLPASAGAGFAALPCWDCASTATPSQPLTVAGGERVGAPGCEL